MKRVKNAAIGVYLATFLGQLILGRPWFPALVVMLAAALVVTVIVFTEPAHRSRKPARSHT